MSLRNFIKINESRYIISCIIFGRRIYQKSFLN